MLCLVNILPSRCAAKYLQTCDLHRVEMVRSQADALERVWCMCLVPARNHHFRALAKTGAVTRGSLLNNCSYAPWQKRYLVAEGGAPCPHEFAAPRKVAAQRGNANPIADWALRVRRVHPQRDVVLFGGTEDVTCTGVEARKTHAKEHARGPWYCRKLCSQCQVPICQDCHHGMH